MRALPVLAVALLAFVPPVLSACGQADCEAPTGCLRAERSGGSCGCAEWEIVDTQAVALPFVVTGVEYQAFGASSEFFTERTWIPALERYTDTTLGTNIRVVVRSPGGHEQVARAGSIDPFTGLERVTASVLQTRGTFIGDGPGPVDISDPETDRIDLWINPAVTLDTNAAGGKVVHWTIGPGPAGNGFGPYQQLVLPVRSLREGRSTVAWYDAVLASFGTEGRAAILRFDERLAGPPMSERYLWLESWVLGDGEQTSTLYQWTPCTDPEAFEVLAETAVPLPNGETFVLQYGVQADATCSPQSPGMYLEMTRGCATGYQIFVDRLSGRLMMLAAPHGTCTGP